MIIKCSAALIITVLVSSQVFAQDLQAKKANEDIMLCMYKAAINIDDRVSDVKSIAPYIVNICQNESDRFYEILRGRVNGPVDESRARHANREKDLEMAGRILIMKRADEIKARSQQ